MGARYSVSASECLGVCGAGTHCLWAIGDVRRGSPSLTDEKAGWESRKALASSLGLRAARLRQGQPKRIHTHRIESTHMQRTP
jgi:hypothetical protein